MRPGEWLLIKKYARPNRSLVRETANKKYIIQKICICRIELNCRPLVKKIKVEINQFKANVLTCTFCYNCKR